MDIASELPLAENWSMLSLAEKDPFPTYDKLRKEKGPIVWDPDMKCWLLLSYELCKIVESDESSFRHPNFGAEDVVYAIKGDKNKVQVSAVVGDDHARTRRLYLKLLSPQLMPLYREEHVIPIINYTIDRFASRCGAELVKEFVDPVPPRVMSSMFGLDWKDDALLEKFWRWHEDLVSFIYDRQNPEKIQKALRSSEEANALFLPLVVARRDARGTDAISQIWKHAPETVGDVGVDDVLAYARDIELGAGDTTTKAIASAIYLYLTDESIREALRNDQVGALNALVEETLRLFGSNQFRFRKAHKDALLDGQAIRQGDMICMLHAAANRDPEHYACPHAVDLKRKAPTDHLAMNVGPRTCVGMHLARLKIRESIRLLITRFPNLRLDPSKEAPRFRGFASRSFGPLHVLF